LKSFDVVDPRVEWTVAQLLLQLLKYRFRPFRNYFNRSVREVAREPSQLQSLGLTHDKPPEPHPLNAAADNPALAAQIG